MGPGMMLRMRIPAITESTFMLNYQNFSFIPLFLLNELNEWNYAFSFPGEPSYQINFQTSEFHGHTKCRISKWSYDRLC